MQEMMLKIFEEQRKADMAESEKDCLSNFFHTKTVISVGKYFNVS